MSVTARRKIPVSDAAVALLSGVDIDSNVSACFQIVMLIQYAVASELLKTGDRLPGIREFGEHSGLSPKDMGKAYRDLEILGIVQVHRGLGIFIREDVEKRCRENVRERLAERIFDLASEARLAGLSKSTFDKIAAKSFSLGRPPYGPVPDEILRLTH